MHRISRRSVNTLLRYGGRHRRDAVVAVSVASPIFNQPSGQKDSSGRWYSALTGACSGPASTKPMKLGTMIPSGRRYESTASDFDTPDVPVEKYEYQAEVSRLMDLIVNSLYSNKEVFLRELISNASDALDKLRFLSITAPELMEGAPELDIRIQTDQENGIITLTDSGIGMTHEELVDSLGTIAHSGTAKFLKALNESKDAGTDSNLIGQFGVGFYSAFLVADKVVVSTKSPKSDKQYVWEGEANSSSYIIREETDPEKSIPRGTSIKLYLKRDDKGFAHPERIERLFKNYSQFVSFPIYTWQEKEKNFVDISKEDLDIGEKNEEKEKEMKQEFGHICDWMKKRLGDKVASVQISNRLKASPCVLVSGKFGWSANMERLMKAETVGDSSSLDFMRSRRVLEINPEHPIIQTLSAACKSSGDDEEAMRAIDLLYDTALISSGFTPESPSHFGGKIYEMMNMALSNKWAPQQPSFNTQIFRIFRKSQSDIQKITSDVQNITNI